MWLTTILTAIGLAMDAVAVSISSGLSVREVRFSQALKMALCFGFFQQLAGGWVVGILRDEFAHDGELQDGFTQFGDVFAHGVKFAEVLGDELPGIGEAAVIPAQAGIQII